MLWDGPRPDKELACNISGIKNVDWLEKLPDFFSKHTDEFKHLFMNINTGFRNENPCPSSADLLYKEFQYYFKSFNIQDVGPLLVEFRLIKTDEEIDMIRKAISISKIAFLTILKSLKPRQNESEIEALLRYEMALAGANDMSFAPIIASGQNACILHYVHNDDICQNGDLLLMDFGAEYNNYAADCSRTIPINGKYSQRQSELYSAVLDVFYSAQKLFRPGTSINEINRRTGEIMQTKLLELGIITIEQIQNQQHQHPIYKTYFPHGTTHFMGLDVHDVGEKDTSLKPGMILSCEPGIYIREEGIGIRIETDMLITETGAEDLMADFPVTISEIENYMK
jgi:Xaa-Pro aminopeptidase